MVTIPKNIEELKSYKPGKPIQQIISEYGLKETAILWNNENNFGPSPEAMKHLTNAMSNSHLYPDPACLELRGLIARKNKVEIENVAVGNGSESLFNNLFNSFFNQGEELLTCEGTFVAVYIWAKANKIDVKTVPLTSTYNFDLKGLAKSIGEKTKAIYLSNPNNPTGAMISRQELIDFMEIVPPHIIVIVDEAYFEFACDLSEDYPDSTLLRYDNVLTLRTFSKAYGIAAIRIGYAIASERMIEALMKVKLTFEPSNVAQAAGVGAIQDTEYLNRTVHNNTNELHKYYRELHKLGYKYVPSFANFVMLTLESAEQVQELFDALMKKGVFVRPLRAFGLPHCLRITVGLPEENALCFKALAECKEELGF
ncbi:MAG: histidinol-phosphate transaminase [Crocinitomicaceae bacterium]|nr:histidinol-phosphate transaminase [Crocinitomicaceae bacterium]|tara:strand:+ start:131 stop:1237 length:1107 start_codon:yes stop_codon:yes gene_type:complete